MALRWNQILFCEGFGNSAFWIVHLNLLDHTKSLLVDLNMEKGIRPLEGLAGICPSFQGVLLAILWGLVLIVIGDLSGWWWLSLSNLNPRQELIILLLWQPTCLLLWRRNIPRKCFIMQRCLWGFPRSLLFLELKQLLPPLLYGAVGDRAWGWWRLSQRKVDLCDVLIRVLSWSYVWGLFARVGELETALTLRDRAERSDAH